MRTAFILSALLLSFTVTAQEGGKVHRVEKSAPVEMKPATDTTGKVIDVMSKEDMKKMEFTYTGTFTEAPAHPECKDATGEQRKACTAQQVLATIRTNLKATPPATPPPDHARVRVSFDVNQFGEVKGVSVNYGGDDQMTQAIVTSLYALPKFAPATNDGVRASSHCSFSFAPALLFAEPQGK